MNVNMSEQRDMICLLFFRRQRDSIGNVRVEVSYS